MPTPSSAALSDCSKEACASVRASGSTSARSLRQTSWSIELNMHKCHLLMSSVVDLDGRILLLSEVGELLWKVFEAEFPGQVDKELATFSLTSAESGFRHEAVLNFARHVKIIDGELELIATPEELATLAAQLRAPTICSRVSSTPKGIGQSAKRAWEEGGDFQSRAAGEPDSKRRKIAEKSVFFKSAASADAPYVTHTQLLPLGGIGFMAHTVGSGEKMGSKHGTQRELQSAVGAGSCSAGVEPSSELPAALMSSPES